MSQRIRRRPAQAISTRSPRAAADAVIKTAKRGNHDMVSAVEMHCSGLPRGHLHSVIRLIFEHMANLYRSQQ